MQWALQIVPGNRMANHRYQEMTWPHLPGMFKWAELLKGFLGLCRCVFLLKGSWWSWGVFVGGFGWGLLFLVYFSGQLVGRWDFGSSIRKMSDNFEMRLGHLLNPRTKQNQKKNVEEASKWLVIGIYIYLYIWGSEFENQNQIFCWGRFILGVLFLAWPLKRVTIWRFARHKLVRCRNLYNIDILYI